MSHSQTATKATSRSRLPLADDSSINALLTGAAAKLPPINVFRALANAPSLARDYMQYFAHLFEPLELDSRIERLLVLLTGKLSGCEYVWRQNVVVAKSLGIPDEENCRTPQGQFRSVLLQRGTKGFLSLCSGDAGNRTGHRCRLRRGREVFFAESTHGDSLCRRLLHVPVSTHSHRPRTAGRKAGRGSTGRSEVVKDSATVLEQSKTTTARRDARPSLVRAR